MSDGTNATEFKLAERTRLETWVFMVKWQSSVTPRFLTESDKGKDSQTTVIKSGKKKREIWTFDLRIQSLLQSCHHLV